MSDWSESQGRDDVWLPGAEDAADDAGVVSELDGEDEEPEGGELEPAAPAPLSEKQIEQGLKRLDSEAARHTNRISEILGEDATALDVCPLCEPTIQGFRWPVPVDEETRQRVAELLGLAGDAAIVDDDEAVMCDRCNGMGETRTGSKVQVQLTRPCGKCGGNGWTTAEQRMVWRSTEAARDVVTELRAVPAPAQETAHELPAFDAWTRPRGHAHYGKNPAYMTADERAADWHGAQ